MPSNYRIPAKARPSNSSKYRTDSRSMQALTLSSSSRPKSRAGTGLSNHGFFFYFARSLRHMQSIQDKCQPKPSNQYFCQIDTHLAVLCAVWQSTDHGKSRKVRGPSNCSRYCNEMTSWQHSGIHTVLQLPSNLSCVGSSAPSAISCKYGISPKQGLVYLITVSSSILQEVEAHAKYPGSLSTETLQSILLPDYIRLTWPFFVLYDCFLLDANVMRSTDHGKSKKVRGPSNFSRYCNEVTSWQHSGIHTVWQLPSNLSSVGSSAPSAISCK